MWLKRQNLSVIGYKHCEKWRKYWLPAFSPPTMFSKHLYCRNVKTRACLEKVNTRDGNRTQYLMIVRPTLTWWSETHRCVSWLSHTSRPIDKTAFLSKVMRQRSGAKTRRKKKSFTSTRYRIRNPGVTDQKR